MLDKVSEVTGNWHLGQNCAFLICKLAIYHETMDFSVADRTHVFFKFPRGVFNFRSISVVDSISVMPKYNMM